jgi:hypothetical protein
MSHTLPLDFMRDVIPVVSTAHCTCGGVTTDLNGSAELLIFAASAPEAQGAIATCTQKERQLGWDCMVAID